VLILLGFAFGKHDFSESIRTSLAVGRVFFKETLNKLLSLRRRKSRMLILPGFACCKNSCSAFSSVSLIVL